MSVMQAGAAARIAVVLTTYNRPDALTAVLQALGGQDDDCFEVVVADDGSREDTARGIDRALDTARIAPGFKRLIHAWQPDEGFRAAAARNMAVAASSGPYLVFLDGDCLPRPDFVRQHRLLAERGWMVTGSRVLLSERLTTSTLAGREAGALATQSLGYWAAARLRGDANKVVPLLRVGNTALRHYRKVAWRRIKSCNLALWRDDYLAVDGFDEAFVGWGHEDADLVLRLARNGLRRKSGAFATEVFHLWHRENPRADEARNRERVEARFATGQIQASLGVSTHPNPTESIRVVFGA